ncbi:hypothetical protein PIB30_075607 [Stylosanthes scabra]|uniref:Uncharacterized protein n=1 Tax=Stylosanthes scabra TaxID=79078 RepID=A0ABU6VP37_9FABA|nr:hypothetical protein [Stylosanthes scabra]
MKVPRPLNVVEQGLYGWVEEAVFTHPFVVLGDSLPDLRRNMRLTEDVAFEGNFVLEVAGSSDSLPFRASRDAGSNDALPGGSEPAPPEWVGDYANLRAGLPPFWVSADLPRIKGVGSLVPLKSLSRSSSGIILRSCLLLVTAPSGWVYWNCGVKDFVVHNLDPLETAACNLLLSLSAGLPKKNDFNCCWILDHSDAEIKNFLDSLLLVRMKQNKLDRLMSMLADPGKMAPRAILPTGSTPGSSSSAAAAPAPASPAKTSSQVPPQPSARSKAKKGPSKRERPPVVNVDEE